MENSSTESRIKMWVFIVCVCLGVLLTFFFVMKFIINQYCQTPKNSSNIPSSYREFSEGRISVVTLPTAVTEEGVNCAQTSPFLPIIRPMNPQPFTMRGGVAVGEGTSSASFCLYPAVLEDTLGYISPQQGGNSPPQQVMGDPPPSYDDLFPLGTRGLDTITEE